MKTKILILSAVICGAFLLGGGVVLAGPPVGFASKVISDGKIATSTDISANGLEFSSGQNTRVLVQQSEFTGGGTSGWHKHPGLTVVTVNEGSVIVLTVCDAAVTYTKGQSFIEPPETPGEVHNASATVPAHVTAVLIVPTGTVPRTNLDAPKC